MTRVTKKDLIEIVAQKGNLTQKASRDAVQSMLNSIRDSLKRGEKVVITGFGTFSVRKKSAKMGRNPYTGKQMTIAAHKSVGFTSGKALRRAIR